jgi:hypothetical protein
MSFEKEALMGFFDRFKKNIAGKKSNHDLYLYSEKELDEYEAFVDEHFGPYDKVLHEIVSPDIHLDIIMNPPTADFPFYRMVTMGVGAFRMNVPAELRKYELEHTELIMYLPGNWNIESSQESDYWPIRMMKTIGRLAINCDTWIGHGHTIHGNAEMSPLGENTKQNCILLFQAMDMRYQELNLRLSSGKKINFYQMYPIYQEELEYKMANSFDALFDLFEEEDSFPKLKLDRKNYASGK